MIQNQTKNLQLEDIDYFFIIWIDNVINNWLVQLISSNIKDNYLPWIENDLKMSKIIINLHNDFSNKEIIISYIINFYKLLISKNVIYIWLDFYNTIDDRVSTEKIIAIRNDFKKIGHYPLIISKAEFISRINL